MRNVRSVVSLGAAALAALSLAACGSSDRALVSAPSAAPASTPVATFTEVAPRDGTSTPIAVTSLVAGTSCPNLQFMVYTYTFKVTASTQYTGGTCANLQVGSRINFTGVRDSETSQVFTVSTLSFATAAPTPPPAPPPSGPASTPVQTEGTVTSVGAGMCPELQFFFGTYAFNVSYATQYTGGECADIKPGAHVVIVGAKRDGEGFVRVTALGFRSTSGGTPQPPSNPTTPTTPTTPTGRPVEGEGVITSVANGTACPALAFYIGEYRIALDAGTVFDRGACSDLLAGTRVHVAGNMTGNSVVASRIAVQNDPRPPIEGEGRVTRLITGTNCPTLTFMISEYSVALDASTTFVGGTCADVAPGRLLGVTAVVTGDRQVLATRIVF